MRGGYIRQVSAGVWTFMPLGWRVHEKIVQIIREEMNAIGGQEMLIDELFTEIDKWIAEGMKRPKRLKMAKTAALAMAEASLIPLND